MLITVVDWEKNHTLVIYKYIYIYLFHVYAVAMLAQHTDICSRTEDYENLLNDTWLYDNLKELDINVTRMDLDMCTWFSC